MLGYRNMMLQLKGPGPLSSSVIHEETLGKRFNSLSPFLYYSSIKRESYLPQSPDGRTKCEKVYKVHSTVPGGSKESILARCYSQDIFLEEVSLCTLPRLAPNLWAQTTLLLQLPK